MKKIFSLCLLCLMTLMAIAQSSENEGQQSAVKHRLRIKILPAGAVTTYVTIYQETGGYDRFGRLNYEKYATDTLDVIETMVAPGIRINISPYLQGYKTKSWTANDAPLNINYFYDQSFDYMMPEQDVELVGLFEYDSQAPTFQPGAGGWYPETGTLVRDYEKGGSTFPSNFNIDEDKDKVLRYVLAGTMSDTYYIGKFTNCQVYDLSRTTHTEVGGYYGLSLNGITINEIVLPSTIQKLGSRSFEGTKVQTLTCFAVTPPELYGNMEYVYDEKGSMIKDETTGEYKQEFKQKVFDKDLDMVVRVPAEAVALYQIADGWKNYTILPMDQNYVDLKLNLMASPNEATLAQYKNMSVELTNRNTGQTKRLLMNGRNTYEFRYLPENTVYSVALRNSRGVEIAKIDNVFIENKNVELTFDRLKTIHNLSVDLTENNAPVDPSFFNNTWLTSTGEYIARGAAVDNMIEGEELRYVLSFGRDLAMKYQQPDTLTTIVGQSADNIAIELEPIASTNATITVIDSQTQRGIEGATVQVTQLLASGEYGKSVTLKTGSNGKASGEVLKTWNDIRISASMYGDRSVLADMTESTDVSVVFSPADGTNILLSHTWQPAVVDEETPKIEQTYSEGRSLQYEFMNLNTGEKIDKFLANYPNYTLYETLPEGTRVGIKASSPTGTIEPVEVEGVVDANGKVAVTLPIVERGIIRVKYTKSESNKPAVLVFNNETGELMKKQPFGDYLTQNIGSLPAGNYFVAAMSQGMQYRGINSKAQLELYNADKDYVSKEVSVGDGQISEVSFYKVPMAMTQLESNLSERSARFGKTTATVGTNIGINVKVAFEGLKERYAGQNYNDSSYPTNCKLEFYVPQGFTCPTAYRSQRIYKVGSYHSGDVWIQADYKTTDNLINNPLPIISSSINMVTATSEWDETERKLTIDWPHYDEGGKMQLSMIPTLSNSFTPEMYLTYTLDGKEYREMLESNTIEISKSGINVPELIVTPTFKVSGTAMYLEEEADDNASERGLRRSYGTAVARPAVSYTTKVYQVIVMDGSQMIGKAQINSNGEWKADCTLPNPKTQSKHHIWAKIAPSGLLSETLMGGHAISGAQELNPSFSYNTEAKDLTYDPNGVIPLSVKMSFFNHHPVHLINQEVLFDFVNDRATPSSYGYSNEEGYNTDFTFEINLSNNDPSKVYAVALHVWTEGPDGGEVITMAHYNERKNCWIAYEKFNTRNIPTGVFVEPFWHSEIIGSRESLDEAFSETFDEIFKPKEDPECVGTLEQLMAQVKLAIDKNDITLAPSWDVLSAATDALFRYDGLDIETDFAASPFRKAPARAYSEEDIAELEQRIKEIEEQTAVLRSYFKENGLNVNELDKLVDGFTIGKADGLTPEGLLADGYMEMLLDDGTKVYLRTDGGWSYVDFKQNILFSVTAESAELSRKMMKISGSPEWQALVETTSDLLDKLQKTIGLLSDATDAAIKFFQGICETYLKSMKAQQATIKACEKLPGISGYVKWWEACAKYEATRSTMASFSRIKTWLTKFKLGDGICTLTSFISYVQNCAKFGQHGYELLGIYHQLPEVCPDDQADADQLRSTLNSFAFWAAGYHVATISGDLVSIYAGLAGMAGLVETGGASFVACVMSIGKIALSLACDGYYDRKYAENINDINYCLKFLECDKKKTCKQRGDCPKCVNTGECPEWPKRKKGPFPPKSDGTLDPSGFVYEGIAANRLEGVTTTVFYKKTTKNQFGDDVEKTIMWDAENYGQINPQLTDENGEYGWMVPTGLWQVKYEKPGYQTEYSDWLPVPPPQLDVNQPMTQMSQPVVSSVKATQNAVQFTFDKYMRVKTLTDANIMLTKGTEKVEGAVEIVNAQGDGDFALANKARFVPLNQLTAGQTITLTVKGDVESYAGVTMGSPYTQDFDVMAEVEQIVADSAVHVIFDQGTQFTVQALPAAAAAGKKANVRVLSDIIASADANELTFDAEGRAVLTVNGEAHGTTAIILQMQDDTDVSRTVIVNVKDESDFICPMPVANYSSGIELEAGTLIELSCELPEAVIYYTLDGTCPCATGSSSVIKYEGPIALTDDLTIKAIAVAPGYADSDISELTFVVTAISDIPVTYKVPTSTYTLTGVKVNDTDKLQKGIYIRNGRKIVIK